MEHLARCSTLRSLDLSHTAVSAPGAASLAALPALERLVLAGAARAASPPALAALCG